MVPYYTRPTPAGIVEHYRAVVAASATPIVAYNVPYRTGRGLDADTLVELAGIPGIVGVKQAVGALDHDTLDLLRRRPPGFQVLSGDDAFIAPMILLGGSGAIAASAHVCTDRFARLVAAALAGDSATASALAHALLPVVAAGYDQPNPACWKAALHATGAIATPTLHRPLTEAGPDATARLLTAIAQSQADATDPHPGPEGWARRDS